MPLNTSVEVAALFPFYPDTLVGFLQCDNLFIWLHLALVVACSISSCGIWDLDPWPRIKLRPPALGCEVLATGPLVKSCDDLNHLYFDKPQINSLVLAVFPWTLHSHIQTLTSLLQLIFNGYLKLHMSKIELFISATLKTALPIVFLILWYQHWPRHSGQKRWSHLWCLSFIHILH